MQTCERRIKVFASISPVLADNLGSHALGGFKEGRSALRPCRHCLITHDELSSKVCLCIKLQYMKGGGNKL